MGAAYCVRRMFPWNSKKERSSSGVASRWMLATLTLVLSDSMAERGRMALPAKCAVGWFAITLPQPSASPIRWLFCSFGDSAPSTCCAKNKAVSLVTARRWRRTRPTTQQRRASQPDARCITREPSPRHPITAWASRTERTQVRPRRHSAHFTVPELTPIPMHRNRPKGHGQPVHHQQAERGPNRRQLELKWRQAERPQDPL